MRGLELHSKGAPTRFIATVGRLKITVRAMHILDEVGKREEIRALPGNLQAENLPIGLVEAESQVPNLCRYSIELKNALTISALM